MGDAMVVARISQEKKESVARQLAAMGTNASSVINQLYDYIDATGTLPFPNAEACDAREERRAGALAWLQDLVPLPEGNRFQHMTDGDIRALRHEARASRVSGSTACGEESEGALAPGSAGALEEGALR